MTRVCYHLQTYRLPELTSRLVATIKSDSPDAVIAISHDADGEELDTATLNAWSDVHISYTRGSRGDFGTVSRYLACAQWLTESQVDYDWLVNITGQDYPVRRIRDIEVDLTTSTADGYLQHFALFGPRSRWSPYEAHNRYRFVYRHMRELSHRSKRLCRPAMAINRLQPWLRVNVSYGLSVGVRSRAQDHVDFHGGSFYGALSRPCVEYLVQECARRTDLLRHFRGTLVPEEALLQTLLVGADRFRLVDDARRFYDFRGSTFGSPRTLGTNDVPRALASGNDFARKFATIEPLNLIDAELGLRTPQGPR